MTAAAAALLLIIGLSAWGINKLLSPSSEPPVEEAVQVPAPEPPLETEKVRPPDQKTDLGADLEATPADSARVSEETPAASDETGEPAQEPASEAAARIPEPAQAPAEETPAAGETAAAKPMELRIKAKELTWLKVIADEDPPREYSLKPGDVKVLKAESGFNLLVGNAGGILLTLDGKELAPLGKSGQVVNLELP